MLNRKIAKIILGLIILFASLIIILFSVPSLRERVVWRIDQIKVKVDYALNPPEEAVFIPGNSETQSSPIVQIDPTPTIQASPTGPIATTQTSKPTSTPEPTPLPSEIKLDGIRYQDQHGLWNYCAPATLAMQLSYWGWEGDRTDTGVILKPFEKDK